MPVTEAKAANWLAHLGGSTTLTAATISSYKSGLRRWAAEQALWQGPSPFDGGLVAQVLRGIKRDRVPGEIAARRSKPPRLDVTPTLLRALERAMCAPTEGHAGLKRWAAACVASHALTRPNELVGAYGQEERALRPEQITFYADASQSRHAQLLPFGHHPSPPTVPHSFTIDFGVAKNDQEARKPPYTVAAPMAVEALWRWSHLRRDLGATGPELFRLPGKPPLSMAALLRSIEAARATIGLPPCRIEGRAFRRGGCAELVTAGAPLAAIQARGRWASPTMVGLYAGAAAIQARAAAALAGTADPL